MAYAEIAYPTKATLRATIFLTEVDGTAILA